MKHPGMASQESHSLLDQRVEGGVNHRLLHSIVLKSYFILDI